MRWNLGLTALALALCPVALQAQQAAGHVIWLSGEVAGISPDKISRTLAKGDTVRPGEVISTGPDSHAHILMTDKGLIALRPESSVRLTTYTYEGRNDGSERAVLDLIKGGIRSVTGAIGSINKDNQVIRSGNVLVGIRGTDHETFRSPAGATYDRVTLGGTYLQTPRGRVDVSPGQVGFVSLAAAPALAQRTPEFMHLTKVAVPAGAPFNEGVIARGKRTLPEQAALPELPAQAWSNSGKGWGRGGRCGEPCNTEVLNGKGSGKGFGRAP